jgi:hypothetical protein
MFRVCVSLCILCWFEGRKAPCVHVLSLPERPLAVRVCVCVCQRVAVFIVVDESWLTPPTPIVLYRQDTKH